MRTRLVLGVAAALALGALLLDMSGKAPRGAGSDHISSAAFVATVPGGGELCQPAVALPKDAARVQMLIGTFGRPVPAMQLRFLGPSGAVVARGSLPAGAVQGLVTVPVTDVADGESSSFCMHVGGSHEVVFGGESQPVNSVAEIIDHHAAGGRISVGYVRGGSESWWQVLPAISARFGLGKSSLFGTWTLPVLALALILVWVSTLRLLAKELR